MVFEELIIAYIKKNYTISIDKSGYCINDGNKQTSVFSLGLIINDVFSYKLSSKITEKWYNDYVKETDKIIDKYLKYISINCNRDYQIIYEKLFNFFENNKCLSYNKKEKYDEFIKLKVNKFYLDNFFNPKFKKDLSKLNKDKTYSELCNTLRLKSENEPDFVKEYLSTSFLTYYKDNILKDKIDYYLKKIDINNGSIKMAEDLNKFFTTDLSLFYTSIIPIFDINYSENILIKKVDDYIEKLKITDTNSVNINGFPGLSLEMGIHYQYCTDKINEWYSKNSLDDLIEDFLSQLVITLGANNWVVTWIGHGQITESNIIEKFGQNQYHTSIIMSKYRSWYNNSIIDASTKVMENKFI